MLEPLGSRQRADLEASVARAEANLDVSAAWLQARGIDRQHAVTFRLGVVPQGEQYGGRLAIPGLGPRGVYSLRYRCLQDHDHSDPEVACQKYLGHPDVGTRIFNVRAIHEARETIEISEGELDAITLEQCGFHAIGIAGVQNWKPHYARVVAGFSLVRTWGDGDKAGREFARHVKSQVGPAAVSVTMPQGEDVNSMFVKHGNAAVRQLGYGALN